MKIKKKRLVFDLEANGLLYDASVIWCICTKDMDTFETKRYGPDDVLKGLAHLSCADILIGHNICGYDIPLILKLYPSFSYKGLRDTLCMSKLFDPERFPDHSLESYGKQFRRYKPEHEDWSQFSDKMLHRCSEDVEINFLTYQWLVEKFCSSHNWLPSLKIEQKFVLNRAKQEIEGVDIDVDHARRTLDNLDKEIAELDEKLLSLIPLQVVKVGTSKGGISPFKSDGTYNKKTLEWINV